MADERQRIEERLEATPSPIQSRVLRETVPGFDAVELTGHAVQQMQIRDLDDGDVLRALREPSEEGLPTEPGRKRVRRNKTARVAVDVVYEELGHRLRVITVIKITRRISGRGKR